MDKLPGSCTHVMLVTFVGSHWIQQHDRGRAAAAPCSLVKPLASIPCGHTCAHAWYTHLYVDSHTNEHRQKHSCKHRLPNTVPLSGSSGWRSVSRKCIHTHDMDPCNSWPLDPQFPRLLAPGHASPCWKQPKSICWYWDLHTQSSDL